VVDSEDLPLNVSRESVQANRVMANLKKTLTGKVLSELKRLAKNKPEDYRRFWAEYGRFIKQGLVVSPMDREDIEPLLYFASTRSGDADEILSLADYVEHMVKGQDDIYYILGDDFGSASRSPHLDAFRQRGIEVLYLIEPVDTVMLMGLTEYKQHKLRNVDEADIDLRDVGEVQEDSGETRESLPEDAFGALRQRFSDVLGERVQAVRDSKNLTASPARLVSSEGGAQRQMYRINRLLDKDYELPIKILELNPRHPLLHNLSAMVSNTPDNPLIDLVIEQVFETALLQDGIHPDPAAMAPRLQRLMEAATGSDLHQDTNGST
jgi:molecular chaperone HtpG